MTCPRSSTKNSVLSKGSAIKWSPPLNGVLSFIHEKQCSGPRDQRTPKIVHMGKCENPRENRLFSARARTTTKSLSEAVLVYNHRVLVHALKTMF